MHAAHRHHKALQSYALRLGLPAPVIYMETGLPTGDMPPLERLVRAVHEGSHRIVLVPGEWVFSDDDAQVRRIVTLLRQVGVRRILALPAPHRWPRYATPAMPSFEMTEQEHGRP
ncbi:hypothetical protein [Streptomyces sp. NBC_00347]|uniref:hypothetical protein n=1 Tax=Streptomyces sp. NBC_00347 TaxID=2975721 RepID=UPI002250FEFE|nr:hypothetical protein [Streptomyces sp. NBC_00347]MCX5126728.1 hypothetical protein [Streptomyces sp. NBC_00347]